jgi:hypothetical protein
LLHRAAAGRGADHESPARGRWPRVHYRPQFYASLSSFVISILPIAPRAIGIARNPRLVA